MQQAASFNQKGKRRCYCCGSLNHLLPKCDKKANTERDKWYDKTGVQLCGQQQHSKNNNNDDEMSTREKDNDDSDSEMEFTGRRTGQGKNGMTVCANIKQNMSDEEKEQTIMLDCGSTLPLFGSERTVSNIRDAGSLTWRWDANAIQV